MSHPTNNSRQWRSRWAAVGAAVAVTLGAGGMFAAHAADESSVVTIDPVRMVDTRIDLGVTGPLQSQEPQDVKITGNIDTADGPAVVVPDGANGVIMNVSVVRPEARGWISVRPGGAVGAASTASHNFEADETSGNSVTVAIPTTGPDTGEFSLLYDAYGIAGPTANVTVDIVGYTTDETLGSLAARVDALEASMPMAVSEGNTSTTNLDGTDKIVLSVSLQAPADGKVMVNASNSFYNNDAMNQLARCSISLDGMIDNDAERTTIVPGPTTVGSASTTRTFDVSSGDAFTANLVCKRQTGASVMQVLDPEMTAVFVPA